MKKEWSSGTNDLPSTSGSGGSRDNDTPLFSLGTLKAKAEATRRPEGHARDDNSGLIDLKSLMEQDAKEKTSRDGSVLHVAPHIPIYPFGAPVEAAPEPVSVSVEPPAPARPSRRARPRWLGTASIAAAVLGITTAAAAAVTAGILSFETPRAAQASLAPSTLALAVASAMLPAPDATPAAELTLASANQESAANAPADEPRPPKTYPHVAKAPVVNRTETVAKTTPAAAPQKARSASDPCKGDLLCAMQRAVKTQKK